MNKDWALILALAAAVEEAEQTEKKEAKVA